MNVIAADVETLWQENHTDITRYLHRRLPDDQVDDAAQEVWLSALEAMHSGNGAHTHTRGWLFRIAHNHTIDRYRVKTRRANDIELDAPSDIPHEDNPLLADPAPSLDEQLEATLLMDEVRCAMGTLTHDQQVVLLRGLDGYEYDEIAAQLGTNYNVVRTRRRRAVVNLRVYFGTAELPLRQVALVAPRPRTRKSKRTHPTTAMLTRDLLLERGPLHTNDVARLLDKQRTNISRMFAENESLFVPVGYCRGTRGKYGTVWGVRGVHDKDAA